MTDAQARFEDPAPVRRHEDAFAAQLDAARLADADIPVRVIEPRGPSAFGGPGLAIVMVPSARVAEAIAVLESPVPAGEADLDSDSAVAAAEGDPDPGSADGGDDDGDGDPDSDSAADAPFAAAPMPPLARVGLWLAALAVVLCILGTLATLL